MALQEYVKKRDFKKTSEPKGRKIAKKARSTNLMFVVQEHHASHLHYDFRLEWEGVLKSWAVPKGPSLDPQTKRLAVQVEDHPLEYGKFEGIIEEGNYGAGEVYLWDTGLWEPTIDVAAGLKKGHLDFVLKGKRLKGSWTLIRTRGTSGSKAQWLLFKRSDKFAKEGDVAEEIGSDEEHVLKAQKKVWHSNRSSSKKAVATEEKTAKTKTSRRKTRKSALSFVEPQLAQLVDAPPEGDNWIHEIKLDGYRIQAHVNHGDVKLMTRTGLDWTDKFPALVTPLQELDVDDAILDGEVVILDEKGHSNFGHLQNALKDHNAHGMYYYLFDCLHLNGKDLRHDELLNRKEALKEIIPGGKSRIRFSEHFEGHGDKLLKEMCRLKLEGIISKRSDSHYVSGRKGTWQKSKCTAEQEFVIGGYTEGTGARAHMGALLLGVYDGKKLRFVGKCGTGFDVKTLNNVLARLKKLEREETPFDLKSPRERGIHWVKPVLSAEITFAQWTNDGHLRIPVFKGLREDKPAKKIVEEVPLIQTETTKSRSKNSALPRKTASKNAEPRNITAKTSPKSSKRKSTEVAAITSPEKIVFKKEKITKSEINDYYQTVAKWILPEIEDRPLSLVRSPAGTDKQSFFQKHVTGKLAGNLEPIDIKEKTDTRQYLTASDKDSLTSLVQMNAYEIHAWNCRRDDIEHPDQIVMDFDPGPGVSWAKVVEAAFDLKEILDVLKLKSFVKLSGGKGVHVHIPIAPKYSWDQIKNFSHILAKQMADQAPDKYTAIISKSKRDKKIFVDYLRNGRGATAVIAYSLRAKPISAVAMPIEWKDLNKYKAANEFTLEKAIKHLKTRKKDPWKGMSKIQQPIQLLESKKR